MWHIELFLASLALLPSSASAAGLYSKTSSVLQLDASNYDRLITKSNYTSIVEFYAPWCGHCKNLQPAFEKAATSLSGIARVAAINCDEEQNKPFCGAQGVQGFPTLKLVRPAKKPGAKPIVEDYQGQRTAKAINDAVLDKVPNHVSRLKDAEVEAWVSKQKGPKALFFSDKGVVSPLVKALGVDFLAAMAIAQVKSSEKNTVQKYGVTSFPSVVLLSTGADTAPLTHSGDMKKPALLAFLSQAATPNPDANPQVESPKPKAKPKSKASASAPKKDKPAKPPRAASETLEPNTPPTESPNPQVSPDAQPIRLPVQPAAKLLDLADEAALQKSCLRTKAGLCVLAFPPPQAPEPLPTPPPAASADGTDDPTTASVPQKDSDADAATQHPALAALAEIAHKHRLRGAKLFPFYTIPSTNTAGQHLLTSLSSVGAIDGFSVIAVNAKKGWYTSFDGASTARDSLENWVDRIRFGEVTKQGLPDGLVREIQAEVGSEMPGEGMGKGPRVREVRLEDLMAGRGGDSPLKVEVVEVDDDYAGPHDEL